MPWMRRFWTTLLLAAAGLPVQAGQALVAVAANFSAPMQGIAEAFAADTGHVLKLTPGATGALYAQIRQGAPFDVLLAADAETPQRLQSDGLAVAGSRFTYATGRLVLWSPQAGLVDDQGAVLAGGGFQHLALANPKLAPYGRAAAEVLQRRGLANALAPRLVMGQNIAQTYQFVATGNAELGFVARSQVMAAGGSAWLVPEALHAPIRQDAVLLRHGADNAAASALLAYLRGPRAMALMRQFGYGGDGP